MFIFFVLMVGAILLYANRTAGPKSTHSVDTGQVQETEQSIDEPSTLVVSTELSFEEAFAFARSKLGEGAEFEWNGITYNTNYKEWNN